MNNTTYDLSLSNTSASNASSNPDNAISIADIQLLLTRHGDNLSESALLQLLKIIKPNTSKNNHYNTTNPDLLNSRGEVLSSGKMVFLPGPRNLGAYGKQKSVPGQKPSASSSTLYLSEGYEKLDITEITDRLMRGGRIMK